MASRAAVAAVVGGLYMGKKLYDYLQTEASASDPDWQNSDELYRAFKQFHDKYALEPRVGMNRAMRIHENFIQEIQSHFQNCGLCHYIEYTGSSYEGVKVRKSDEDDDLEFDVMVIIDQHKFALEAVPDKSNPGYAWLKLPEGNQASPGLDKSMGYWNIFGYFTGEKYVDSVKTVDRFFGQLQKLIDSSETMKGKVKLVHHGPAVQMDVYPDSGILFWGPRLYSVDVVPAYVVGATLYVSKPIKDENMGDSMLWRRSFSLLEKRKLTGGAKNVLRVLKVVRNGESGLASLTSYHLKTAVFYEMDEEYDWSERSWAQRFIGVLGRLEMCLSQGVLPHYYIPELNLLSTMSSYCIRNIRDRIKRIRTKKNEMMKILSIKSSW